MLGDLIVDITLDYDQSQGLGSLDGRDWTRLTPYSTVTYTTLNLPAPNMVLDVSYSYGRDRFIVGEFQTGLATIVLNNDNGEWSPNSGVNTIGGDKLEPGMIVRIGHRFDADAVDTHLEAVTGKTWNTATNGPTRAIADAETATGFIDGRTWTAHVASPGDIDLDIVTEPGGRSDTNPWDSNIWARWVGRIWSIEDRYDAGGQGATTVLYCVDYMADLSQYDPGALVTPEVAELTSTRWTTIWVAAINDGNMIGPTDTGIYDVEASNLPSNYLEEARVCARAEGGAIYADHGTNQGRLRFRGANWLIEDPRSAVVQWSLGTDRLGIISATTDYSIGRVFNDLHYSNSSTTVDVSDATSIATYSTRSLNRTVLNNDNTDLDTIADRDLALLKDAKLVITGVEIRPRNLFEEVLCADIAVGDLVEVTIENNGWSYTQNLHVAGVSQSWIGADNEWVTNLRLDSRDGDTVIS